MKARSGDEASPESGTQPLIDTEYSLRLLRGKKTAAGCASTFAATPMRLHICATVCRIWSSCT